jgi:hypothetical protein
MGLFRKLLELKVVAEEDWTETWWEKSVLLGLARDEPDIRADNRDSEPASALRPGRLN